MNLQPRIPLVEDILGNWKSRMGKDFEGYKNHVYRMAHCVLALRVCSAEEQQKVVIAACHHDIGIWSDHTVDYLPPSIAQVRQYLDANGLQHWAEEIELMVDMHHKLRPFMGFKADQFPLVEVFRQGDLVDFSWGWVKFGLPSAFVKSLQQTFPNAGFHKMLMGLAGGWFRRHPLSPPPFMKW